MNKPTPPPTECQSEDAAHKLVLNSRQLFRDGDIVYIEHEGERYQLRRTRENKLILTK